MLASANPVIRLVTPGPSVDKQTPALPVNLPYASAIKAAACSCLHKINSIFLLCFKEIIKSAFSSPGTPNIRVTPSSSRHFTNKSDAFISFLLCKSYFLKTSILSICMSCIEYFIPPVPCPEFLRPANGIQSTLNAVWSL